MFRTWWQKLFVFARSRNLRRRRLADPRRMPRTRRLSMTALEDRITPAFNTLISLNPTIGVNVSTLAGTTTFAANASGANVSILDVSTELSLGRNVVITSGSTGAEAGNIAMSGFANTSFNNLAGTSLTIQSGSGANLIGDISLQGVTFQQAASYTINANQNVTFDQSTVASSIFVTAVTGSVTNSAMTSIQATNLAISAVTGIGSAATPLNTTVQNLEAETSTGGIFITNQGNLSIGGVSGGLSGVRATVSGDIQLTENAGSTLTLTEGVQAGGGNVSLSADDMAINAAINAGAGFVALQAVSAGRAIDLGSNTVGRLGLTDTELDFVTAGTALRIGAASNTGGIFITNPITALTGFNTLHLITGAAIADGTAAEQADLIVANLALEAGLGIGNADSIDVAGPAGSPINVAFKNTNLGVQIAELGNAAGMVINSVDGVATSSNSGTTTTLTAASPLTFAVNTISSGDLLATATEISDAPVFADRLTVNAGVTVQSTGGNVALRAGDDVVLNAGSVVQSNVGSVTLNAAFNDLDNEGGISANGATIQAVTKATFTAQGDIVLGVVSVNNGDITIVTAGAIQLNQALTASGIVRLQAGTGIASTAAAGAITANALGVRNTTTGDIQLDRDNLVQVFAGVNLANNAGINFRNTSALLLDNVTADGALFAAVNGVATTGGLGAIRLQATGLTQTAVGLVTSSQLGIHNATTGDVVLDQGNTVQTFAAINAAVGAGINFRNTIALSLDMVSGQGSFTTVNGVTTTGAGGTVRLQQTGLTQTDVGIVTSDFLGVQNTVAGDVMLDRLNQVNTFAASNTFPLGQVVLNNGRAVLIGSVGAQGTFGNTDGIVTNNGVAYLRAAGNITQTAQGLVSASALAVLTTTGQIIRLDQGNAVPTFAANNGVTGGLVNFRTTGSLIIANVASNSGLLQAVTGITLVDGTALIRAANGISQSATGFINTGPAGQFAVRNDATGDISLLQTDYVMGTGNSVGTFAAESFTAGGRVDFATLGSLTLGTIAGDGTFLQARGIQATSNGRSNLRTGKNFTATDTNFASPLINLGANGDFLLNPGQSGGNNTIIYNAEALAGNFRLGTRNSAAPEAQAPGVNNVQNPPDATMTNNAGNDAYTVRPSHNVVIIVNGNVPTVLPGDSLALNLADPTIQVIQFVPGGVGSGRFNFTNGGAPMSIAFTGIENVVGLSVAATSVQTGPTSYSVAASGTLQGQPLSGGITSGQAAANPFIVSPNFINPVAPFGAARIVFGDFNGDGVADLILGNGPNNAPLVTVIDGRQLFLAPHPLAPSDILSQFFAYDPQFFGGIFVAAGDLNGDGKVEIITGADSGGGPHVNAFSFNPAGSSIYNNAVQFSSAAFPLGGFFAYAPTFAGGVRVAVGDVNGDFKDDIITGAGPSGGPHVKVYSGATGQVIREFFAYAPNFTGGVYVGAGDYNLDGKADILTGAGAGGGPHVKVYNNITPVLLTEFFAFQPEANSVYASNAAISTGVGSVSLADVNGDGKPDILVTSSRGPRTRLRAFLGNGANPTPFAFPAPTLGFPQLSNGDLFFSYLTDGSNATGLFGST